MIRYTASHEWIHLNGKTARVGITAYAQKELGEIAVRDPENPADWNAVEKERTERADPNMVADVQEELERLAAHAGELRALIASPEPAGRRLDFLGQELTREANTLCSKSGDLELTRIGLDLKTVIDQLKEQAANVE